MSGNSEEYESIISDLRAKLQAAEETGAEATRIIVAAVSDQMSALNLVSRIREAIGDNGRRMQDELIGYCAQLYRSNKAIEEERDGFWRSRAEAAEGALVAEQEHVEILEAEVGNLASLVRILVHSLRKVNPNSSNIIRAMDYLTRTGLTGSILRDDEPQPKEIPDSGGHIESADCWCGPTVEEHPGGRLVIHNQTH